MENKNRQSLQMHYSNSNLKQVWTFQKNKIEPSPLVLDSESSKNDYPIMINEGNFPWRQHARELAPPYVWGYLPLTVQINAPEIEKG